MYCLVALARPLPEPLTYAVPIALVGAVQVGSVVLAPLGAKGGDTGYVVAMDVPLTFDAARVKPLVRLIDPVPAFNEAQLAFFRWVADYYLAPLGLVIQTALPSSMQAKRVTALVASDDGVLALAARDEDGPKGLVLRELVARPGLTARGLARRLADELDADAVNKALASLRRAGRVLAEEREVSGSRGMVDVAKLAVPLPQALASTKGGRAQAVIHAIASAGGQVDASDITHEHGAYGRSVLTKLVARGTVTLHQREQRDPLLDAPALGAAVAPSLNEDQRAALTALCAPDAAGAFLLFGVTGSGKTEVFLGAAAHALALGKQVLVLVPEIGLTPQLVGRFRARFGDDVAVLHSGLTGAERLAQWRRIRAGEANVAVGARSALFAPFRRLGLVVVDEEHDDSYKQDEGVSYHARDLAVVLGRRATCPVVLASATPSLETWHNAQAGRYAILRLPKRATPAPVPVVELVDRTQEAVERGQQRPLLAPSVAQALRDTFKAGGQAIVLYNRRGFATMVECTSCGGTYECPNCGITMTLHRRASIVQCHYCSLKLQYTGDCPICKAHTLDELGKGTERVEDQLAEQFPDIPIARMDADTTKARGAHQALLDAFRAGETRLLVGTQIVAKGHDFPNVHTAVVVSADRGFRMPDFRASERTYALLVQLAGRAGRGDVPGRVFVQTYTPDHYVLTHLHDVEGFLAAETRLRHALQYPPHRRLTLVRAEGVDRQQTLERLTELAGQLRGIARRYAGVTVLGPAPAALPRLVSRWRFQLIVRGADLRAYRAMLAESYPQLWAASARGVRVSWDVDARTLM